jgi:hypothetical protein
VNRQASPVPQAPVRADFNQTPNILVDIPSQVTLGQVLPVDDLPKAVDLDFAQLVHPRRQYRIQVGFSQDLRRNFWPHAIDTAEGYVGPLSVWDIYPRYSNHGQTPFLIIRILALPLGVASSGTDNSDHAFSLDDAATVASRFDRCAYFHDYISRKLPEPETT